MSGKTESGLVTVIQGMRWTFLIFLSLCLAGCTFTRYVVYNFADINDHKKFPDRPLQASSQGFRFEKLSENINPKLFLSDSDPGTPLSDFLQKTPTVAFLMIRKDTILYEQYFKGYDSSSIVPSFSMAKSVTSALIGAALADGLIASIDEPAIRYIPEWKGRGLDAVTIRHLLQMNSGISFSEQYANPFADVAKFYYGRNLRRYLSHMKPETAPGTRWRYHSGNTQVLGLVLERALKGKSVTQYLQEKIWTPLGMEFDASWSIDKKKDGMEKTFCCLNARARDFARFGRLYLNKGNWNGQQVLPQSWVEASTKHDKKGGGVAWYQNQFWLGRDGDYLAEGILGQFVYVCPSTETIIVRLGKSEGKVDWKPLLFALARMQVPKA